MPERPEYAANSRLIPFLDAHRDSPDRGHEHHGSVENTTMPPATSAFALDASIRAILDGIPNATVVCDRNGQVLYASPQAVDAFFREAPTQDESLPGLMPPPSATRLRNAFEQTLADGRPYFGRFRLHCSDGVDRKFDATITNLVDNPLVDGIVVKLERTQATQSASDDNSPKQERYEAAYQFSSYAVTITRETDAILLAANRGFEKVTGYSREEAVGRSLTHMGLEPTADLRKLMSHLHTAGSALDWTANLVKKDGKRIALAVTSSRFRYDGVDCVISFSRDVTARSQALADMRENARRLRSEQAELHEKNVTLKQILEHVGRDRSEFQTTINERIREALEPLIKALMESGKEEERSLADILGKRLHEVVDVDWRTYDDNLATLTPREQDVCSLIRQGHTSQKIADELGISLQTVHKHRQVIRRKLQLSNQAVSLISYLRTHEKDTQ